MKVKEFYTAKHILNFNLNLNYKIDLNYESKRVFNRKPAQQNPDEQVLATALLGILTRAQQFLCNNNGYNVYKLSHTTSTCCKCKYLQAFI